MNTAKTISETLEAIEVPHDEIIPFVDIETTGLDPQRDELLQVAMVLTDKDLNELARFNWIVKYDQWTVERMKEKYHLKVVEMHEATRLWDRVQSKEALHSYLVDKQIAKVLSFIRGEDRWPVKIAGNSVRFDRDFLYEKLELTSEHLSHQVIDISSVLGFFRATGNRIELEKVERDHDAMSDILDCIRQARAIKDQVSVAVV